MPEEITFKIKGEKIIHTITNVIKNGYCSCDNTYGLFYIISLFDGKESVSRDVYPLVLKYSELRTILKETSDSDIKEKIKRI